MGPHKRSNLTLHTGRRKSQRLKKAPKSSWPDTLEEILSMVKTSEHLINSPKHGLFDGRSTSKKRTGSMSPYINPSPFKRTPSKLPRAKKMRKCLFLDESYDHGNWSSRAMALVEESDFVTEETFGVKNGTEDKSVQVTCETGKLFSEAIQVLKREDLDSAFLDFFRLVREGKFPLDNIALTLFIDVIRWFSCETSTLMRYSRESKIFWKLGYRLFGGRFVQFMGGLKNEGQIVMNQAKRGAIDPSDSRINFAVPSMDNLREYDPYYLKDKMKNVSARPFAPGLLSDMITTLGEKVNGISCCLTFDGKKIKQGLTLDGGDVDLFGFETKESLDMKKERLNRSTKRIYGLKQKINAQNNKQEIVDLNSDLKEVIRAELRCAIKTLSLDIFEIKDLRKKRDYAKQKLIERCCDENWRNSKFAMAISATIAHIHDTDSYLHEVPGVLDEMLCCLTALNHSMSSLADGYTINIHECKNYHSIQEAEESFNIPSNSREIKQRTEKWYERRKHAKVTGSSMFAALGLDGLKKQREHFEEVMCGSTKQPVTEKVAEFMKYGTENEVNAVATLVGKIMPAILPAMICCEEGFVEIDVNSEGIPFMVVSPDGSIRSTTAMETTEMAVELKCPVYDIQKCLPERYVLQCQAEMDALSVDSLVYVCWRPDFSSVFIVKKHPVLYANAYQTAKELYGENAKRVKSLSSEIKELKRLNQLVSKEEETVQFVGVFPSLKHDSNASNRFQKPSFKESRLNLLLDHLVKVLEDRHELVREKATEAVVFMCSTLDRHLTSKSVTAPVCWFTKGNSLDTQTMRNIEEHVLDACFKAGIHIPAVSFDGQWHNIAVRDIDNKPLTKLQLQKEVWRETESTKKQVLLNNVKKLNSQATWEKKNGILVGPVSQQNLPKLSRRVYENRLKEASKQQAKLDATDFAETEANSEEPESTVTLATEEAAETNIPFAFDADTASVVLKMLQTDPNSNRKHAWSTKTADDVIACCQTEKRLKRLLNVDLKVLVRFLKKKGYKLRESDSKDKKSKAYQTC